MSYGIEFYIPTAIALFSTAISIIESEVRRISDAENKKMMLDIFRKPTSKARKTGTKTSRSPATIQKEHELKERKQTLQENKFNLQKNREIRETIYEILDRL